MPSRFAVDPRQPDTDALSQACKSLAQGLVVAVPTDTLYGLAVDPRRDEAVARLYRAKGRPVGQPIPLIAGDVDQVERHVGAMSALARALAARFWPGPLTLIIAAHPNLAARCVGEGGSVAVRVPAHGVARHLAWRAGHPLTATSANRTGERPPRSPAEFALAIRDAVAVILDAGPVSGGAASTIVDARGTRPTLVRAGAVPWARVLESLQ